MIEIKAFYFDGKTSEKKHVTVQLSESAAVVLLETPLRYERKEIQAESPMANLPLVLDFKDGSRVEVPPENFKYKEVSFFFSKKSQLLFLLENNWLSFALSFSLFVAIMIFLVQVILPKISEEIAHKVPQKWANKIDTAIVSQLDGPFFSPSTLAKEKQDQVQSYLKSKLTTAPQILFRKLSVPNAFALAGNTVFLGDELIEILHQDEEILAVALHEVGHLKNRHVLSMLISSSALSILGFLIIGDMVGGTEWVLNIGIFLMGAQYSRDYETQADQYAIQELKRQRISPACFKKALKSIEKSHNIREKVEGELLSYLSSHPDTEERVRDIKDVECTTLQEESAP